MITQHLGAKYAETWATYKIPAQKQHEKIGKGKRQVKLQKVDNFLQKNQNNRQMKMRNIPSNTRAHNLLLLWAHRNRK